MYRQVQVETGRKTNGLENLNSTANSTTHSLLGAQRVTFETEGSDAGSSNKGSRLLCHFFLLGPFTVTDCDGTPLTPRAQKTCAMLAMLALSPRSTRTRTWLRDKLWSDRGDEQAAASLRQALLDAKRSLGPLGKDVIQADKKSISLNLDHVQLDTDVVIDNTDTSLLNQEKLEQALAEDLLEGMDIRDPEFEDWLTLERQVWQQRITQQYSKAQAKDPFRPEQKNQLEAQRSSGGQTVMTTAVSVRFAVAKTVTKVDRGRAIEVFNEYVTHLRDIAANSGGRIFQINDLSAMMEFERPVDAVRFARKLHQHIANLQTNPQSNDDSANTTGLAIGINSGIAHRNGNQVSGTEVDIAWQAAQAAERNETLITEASCALVKGKTDLNFFFRESISSSKQAQPLKLFSVSDVENVTDSSFQAAEELSIAKTSGPSIAVLPFRTTEHSVQASSNDYIGEGLADDLIVALSKNQWLNVISRNSSFSFEPSLVSNQRVANELNVDYVVSGSIKHSKNKLNIEIMLESGASQRILWSDKFSIELSAITQLQELVASKVSAHLLQNLGRHEQLKAYENRIDDLTTWQLVHRGHWHMARRTATGVQRAQTLYQQALERDPYQTDGLLALAWWHFWRGWSSHGRDSALADLQQAEDLCRKAMLMDPSDGRIYAYLGTIEIMRNNPEKSLTLFDEAIRLNPSLSLAYASRGSANLLLGSPELAPTDINTGLSLNPSDYYRFHTLAELASSYLFLGDYEKSIEAAESSIFLAPRYWYARLIKISCLVQRNAPGDNDKAAQEKSEIAIRNVKFGEKNILAIPFKNRCYNELLIDSYSRT